MDHKRAKTYNLPNLIGFHYFPDSLHYRAKDLDLWLPRLKQMNARWLVLNSPTSRAIPEDFISTLAREKINTVIDFNLPLSQETPWQDLATLLRSYGKWGAHYALLNQRPNNQDAWGAQYWKQPDLVESHAKQFIQFGKMALENGIKPVFSPLFPGGDYWDMAYLEGALKTLAKSAEPLLLHNMVLSAYAWDFGKSLNWGEGGAKVWKDVKPYKVPKNSQDQRGFRAFEWYAQKADSVLGKTPPILLLQAGISADTQHSIAKSANMDEENRQMIYGLLQGENVHDPENNAKLIHAISPHVLACNFYLLSSDDPHTRPYGWFSSDGMPLKSARAVLRKYYRPEEKPTKKVIANAKVNKEIRNFKYGRYILVANSLKPRIPEILKKMHAYIKRYKPVIGFSCEQAKKSAYILVIAYESDFCEQDIQQMQDNGSLVRVIAPEKLQAIIQKA